jgi:NADH-quinone oxidoreductase subunit N
VIPALNTVQTAGWDIVPILGPMLVVTLTALVAMALDLVPSAGKKTHVAYLSLFGTLAGIFLAFVFYGAVGESQQYVFADAVVMDGFALFFHIVILAATALTILLSLSYLEVEGIHYGEYYALLLFSAVGGMIMAASADLITIFLGLETLSIPLYVLAGFNRANLRSNESALKYFLLGSFSSGFFLYGIALVYGQTGTTSLRGLANTIQGGAETPVLLLAGMALLLVGFGFKVATVPFHMWTPDVYEGAPTSVTAYMATAVKAAGFAAFLRVFFYALPALEPSWGTILWWLAVATMTVGNVLALVQTDMKRMLAYSSIAHAGYVLVGVVATYQVRGQAASAVLYYMMAYTVSSVLALGSLNAMGSRGRQAVSYEDYAGAGRRHPMAALPFAIGILSLMGFPPTAGFFGKYYVFSAAVEAGGGMIWLAVIGVLTSAIGAYYYLRVLVYLFMRSPQPDAPIAIPMRSGYVAAVLVVSGYFVLRMGVSPDSYIRMAIAAVS